MSDKTDIIRVERNEEIPRTTCTFYNELAADSLQKEDKVQTRGGKSAYGERT